MIIERLGPKHFQGGFLEALSNLSEVGEISSEQFFSIYQEVYENPGHHKIFVAIANGTTNFVTGTITLLLERKFIHAGGLVAHIEDVATRRGWERHGIGRALVDYAVQEAKKAGCYKIILDCSNKNIPFYEKCGFRVSGLCMRRDLK